MNNDPADSVVEEFLEGKPTASEVRVWREALERRLAMFRKEAERDPESADAMFHKIKLVEQQLRTIREEEAISGFVEESVRAIAADMGPVQAESAPHDSTLPPWTDFDIPDEPESY